MNIVLNPQVNSTPRPASFSGAKAGQESNLEPTFTDRFSSSWRSELPSALAYSAGTGATVGAVSALMLPAATVANLGYGLALGGLAGLGLGLVGSATVAALKATAQEPGPPPVRTEPVVPKPEPIKPHPDLASKREIEEAKAKLEQRGELVKSYVDALQTVKDSAGRVGRETECTASEQTKQAEKDWQNFQQQREEVRQLEQSEARIFAQQRIEEIQSQRRDVLQTLNRVDGIYRETAGRVGIGGRDAARSLDRDLQQEMQRMQQALKG